MLLICGSCGLSSIVVSKLMLIIFMILVLLLFVVGVYWIKIGLFLIRVWLIVRCKSGCGVGSLVRMFMMGILW